jgi:hypothetical protein
MIARQIAPGIVVYVSEDDVWRELLLGERPRVPTSPGADRLWVMPDNQKLSLVEEMAVSVSAAGQHEPPLPGAGR